MFNLTKTFTKEQFQITPILMDGNPVFLPQEIGEQLGYVDLSDSIRKSEGFKEKVDYIVVEGEALNQLREILRGSATPLQISPMTRSLAVITESGFWGTAFRSNKPDCVALRIWVTSEVLPSLRKTGQYAMPGQTEIDMVKIQKTISATKKSAKGMGFKEAEARKAAAEMVRKVHQVDIYELLNIDKADLEQQRVEKVQRLFAATQRLARQNGMSMAAARQAAREQVKKVHQVDVWELLGSQGGDNGHGGHDSMSTNEREKEKAYARLVRAWYRVLRDTPVLVRDVISAAENSPELAEAIEQAIGSLSLRPLGYYLRSLKSPDGIATYGENRMGTLWRCQAGAGN